MKIKLFSVLRKFSNILLICVIYNNYYNSAPPADINSVDCAKLPSKPVSFNNSHIKEDKLQQSFEENKARIPRSKVKYIEVD